LKKRLLTSIAVLVGLAATATVLGVAAGPAASLPGYAATCTGCHTGTTSGSVSAVPDAATPAAGATYHVAITNGLTAAGSTGYWIAKSDALGTTGASTGVFAGGPGSSQTSYQAALAAPAVPGTYYYVVWNVKGPDNSSGMAKAATYSITVPTPMPGSDLMAPVTTCNAPAVWKKTSVTVAFSASDNVGGSGVGRTEYSLDGGTTWTIGTSCLVSTAGTTTIKYRSVDVALNMESMKTAVVRIDKGIPKTTASAVAVKYAAKATFKFRVADPAPSSGKATVKIQIKNKAGKVVKTIAAGSKKTNVALTFAYKITLKRGVYTYRVLATDLAGNVAKKMAVVRLTVK
jgi:hypothetical protein